MNLRSITGFLALADPIREADLRALRGLVGAARADFACAGFPIQTARVATQFPPDLAPRDLTRYARDLEAACTANAIDYASLGALRGDHPLVEAIPTALSATENVFVSAHIASRDDGINLTVISDAARVIRTLADSTPNGSLSSLPRDRPRPDRS